VEITRLLLFCASLDIPFWGMAGQVSYSLDSSLKIKKNLTQTGNVV
jgi:hypothetical protein